MPCMGCGCSAFSSEEKTSKCGCACHSDHGTDCFWRSNCNESHDKSWSKYLGACNCECHHKKDCKWMVAMMSPPYSICTCGRLEFVKKSQEIQTIDEVQH